VVVQGTPHGKVWAPLWFYKGPHTARSGVPCGSRTTKGVQTLSCEVTRTTTREPRPCHVRPLAKPQGSPDLVRGVPLVKSEGSPDFARWLKHHKGTQTLHGGIPCKTKKPQDLARQSPLYKGPRMARYSRLVVLQRTIHDKVWAPLWLYKGTHLARSELPCGYTKDLTLQCLCSFVVLHVPFRLQCDVPDGIHYAS
jgi:hypothetical protein